MLAGLHVPLFLFLFFARIIDVSLGTIRTLTLVRGKKKTAGFIGFFEVSVYILALNSVVKNLDNMFNLMFYAAGFAAGNIIGGFIEEKMAIGYYVVQVITKVRPVELATALRKEGFGVTLVEGEGRDGPRFISHVMLKRKEYSHLMDFIDQWDNRAFITVSDCRRTKGGFIELKK